MDSQRPIARDQTIGPPWHYNERHRSIVGRKVSTGGSVTVALMPDDGLKYHPLTNQAHAFGRLTVDFLNERDVYLPDPRLVVSRHQSPTTETAP